MTYFNTSSGKYNTTSTTWPQSYTCCCACDICMAGGCCLRPQRYLTYPYWWYYWPVTNWPAITVTGGITIKPDEEKNVDKTFGCVKCGNVGITTRYHKGTHACPYSEWDDPGPIGEHLHRRCTTCGWSWRTPTADTPKEEVKVAVADKEAQVSDAPRCTCPKVKPFEHEISGGTTTYRPCKLHWTVTY